MKSNNPKKNKHINYSLEIENKICELISNNAVGLKAICKVHTDLPDNQTIRKWLRENTHPSFTIKYARAKEEQAETMAEQIIYIADLKDMGSDDKRVRIDTRKWLMGKLKPKKYGDTVEHKVKGNIDHNFKGYRVVWRKSKEA